MFRKLRPTVVINNRGDDPRIICTLCMHPIAYYADSWAGAMCPTDDVIAHLMLMRGDELALTLGQHPDHLYMRRDGDHRPDHIVKSELLDQILADGFLPIMAFDDRNQVVKMWRERGIPCAQVAEGDF